MRDNDYLLINEDSLSSTKNGEALKRTWIKATPVIFELSATGTISGSTTAKVQVSDNGTSWTDLFTFSAVTTTESTQRQRKRVLVQKDYVRGVISAAGSVEHFELGVIPAGQYTDPD